MPDQKKATPNFHHQQNRLACKSSAHQFAARALSLLAVTLLPAVLLLNAPVALADNQPPSTVNGIFTSAISDTSIRVTWNKPWDDTGIAGYNVYRDGGYYDTVRETNYIDRNANPGTFYDLSLIHI